ncbi:MAG: fumarylacetoacetate hydrolase family protein [Ilumatobacteraceae bacterium]
MADEPHPPRLGRRQGRWCALDLDGTHRTVTGDGLSEQWSTTDVLDGFRSGRLVLGEAIDDGGDWESPLVGVASIWCCLGNAPGVSDGDAPPPFDAFVRAPSSLSGAVDGVRVPVAPDRATRGVRHELEVGLLLGSTPEFDDPLGAVSAVVLALDLAAAGSEDRSFRKSFPTFCPVGPVVVPIEWCPDLASLTVELTVNGSCRQTTAVADLVRGPAEVLRLLGQAVGPGRDHLVLLGAPPDGGRLAAGDAVVARWGIGPDLVLEVVGTR